MSGREILRQQTTVNQEVPLSPWRLRLFAMAIATMFAVLLARLWYLQVLEGEEYRNAAEGNRRRQVRTVAPRGVIEDRKGRVLATNSAQFTVFVEERLLPKKKQEKEAALNLLASVLERSREEIDDTLKRNRHGADPIAIAEGVDQHTLARIAEHQYLMPGVNADVEPVRRYPAGFLAAHLLGYIGPLDSDQAKDPEIRKRGYRPGDFIGQAGVERQYDHLLNGVAGGIWYETDAKNRRVRELERDQPIPGATLRLSLDLELQRAAETALGSRKGAVVALDPGSGEVLAMVSWPTFNPNLLAHRPLSHKVYQEQIAPGLFNRATMAQQSPGSTFKIVSAAAGLGTDGITRSTSYYCSGGLHIGSYFKRCHGSHGSVSLLAAMAGSCDVYFYQLGFKVNPTTLASWADKFGLGQETGIDFPSDKKGYIPSPARHAVRAQRVGNPDTGWYPGFTANTVIGQGDVLTTPLQMALVVSAIANGGTVYAPRVVQKAISSKDGSTVYEMKPRVMHRLGLAPVKIALIARSLRAVVENGTAGRAAVPGIAVAGKTGTAELKGRKGMSDKANDAWFVCYAPFEKPTIAICVYLESEGQSYHGGTDAAPIARSVLAAHFGIKEAPPLPPHQVR